VNTSGYASSSNDSLLERVRRATIGRYDVYAELGAGGMATVYLALDLALDRHVAIKVLHPSLASAADNIERFKREAKVAASLDHPNIIGIYAVGDDPELAYFVMKYIEGRAVDSVVREHGAQTVPFVRSVVVAAGKALHYAHTKGVIHRDVKPANFMLDKEGWLVVTDFGIAKLEEAKGLTMTGSIIGTPYYMAPEQFQGVPVTAAADQYALGVVTYELLTGVQPFAGDTVAEVMKGHLFDPIPSVRTTRPDVPEALDATITKMLAKDPAERFATLEQAVAAFGGMTSSQEHEVRTQIINLAKSAAMTKPQISVPISPSPVVRTPNHAQVRSMPDITAPLPAPVAVPAHSKRAIWTAGILALLIGVFGATALLRPDIINRARKTIFAGGGNLADTAQFIRNEGAQTAAGDYPVMAADSAKREKEVLDSVEQVLAAEVRDSIAQSPVVTPPRPRVVAPVDTTPRTDTAVAATRPPQTIPGAFVYGTLRIGSRCPGAVLYLGPRDVRPIGRRGLQDIEQMQGPVRIQVRTLAGASWDTTFTVTSGTLHTIGFRPVRCQ
jgi:serine/threonine protein kinase